MTPTQSKIVTLSRDELDRLRAKSLEDGTDFYNLVVSTVLEVPTTQVSKEDRGIAKITLFGYMYSYRVPQ